MLGNIKIGQYLPGDSWFYRLDARTKILTTLVFVIVVFFANSAPTYGIVTAYALFLILTSGVSFNNFVRSLKPILFLMVFSFVINVFVTRTGDIIDLKIIKIYIDGVIRGGIIISRLILIVSITSLLTFTTKPTDMTDGIEAVMKPFKYIGVPTSELALMISISLRFIPTLLEEAEKIMKAQSSRGADFVEGKLKDKIIQIISLLIPMFVIAFKRAEDLANAMEARGYVPGQQRSRLNELKYQQTDYLYYIFITIFVFGIVYFRNY